MIGWKNGVNENTNSDIFCKFRDIGAFYTVFCIVLKVNNVV